MKQYFTISLDTMDLIREHGEKIKEITPERILMELQKVFKHKSSNKQRLYFELKCSKLLDHFFFFDFSFTPPQAILETMFKTPFLSEFLFFWFPLNQVVLSKFLKDKLKISNDIQKELEALEHYHFSSEDNSFIRFHDSFQISKRSAGFLSMRSISRTYNSLFNVNFSLKDLKLKPVDLMNMGFKGKELGILQRKLLETILKYETGNDKELLTKFVNEKCLNLFTTNLFVK